MKQFKKEEGQGGTEPTATSDDMPIEESANAKTFKDVFKQGETKIKVSSEVARDYDADVKLPKDAEYTEDGYPKSIRVKLPYGENKYMNLTYDKESKTYKQKSGREFEMAIDENGNISLIQTDASKNLEIITSGTVKTTMDDQSSTILEDSGLTAYYNADSKTFYGISLENKSPSSNVTSNKSATSNDMKVIYSAYGYYAMRQDKDGEILYINPSGGTISEKDFKKVCPKYDDKSGS